MNMELPDRGPITAAILRDRLDTILERDDAGNGTPLAAALVDALTVDLRLRSEEDHSNGLLELTDEQLIHAAIDLSWALATKNDTFDLPFGARVVTIDVGGIEIGGETWVLDADRPGLHPVETVPRGADGNNLELLRREIGRLTRRLRCREIGLPSPHNIGDTEIRQLLQFPPCAAAGGVVLQKSVYDTGAVRFRAALPVQITAMAERLVQDMRKLWKYRVDVAARVEDVRILARNSAAEHGCRLHAIAIDMGQQDTSGPASLYVEYEGLNDALRPGLILDYVPGGQHEVRPRVRGVPGSWRSEDRRMLAALGADGRIDGVARGIVLAAPEGSAAVMARLANDLETLVAIPVGKACLYATLFWRQGHIRADMSLSGRFDMFQNILEIKGVHLPQTIAVAAAGRRLDEIIELPFTTDATIDEIESGAGFIRVKFTAASWLLNTETTEMWQDAARADAAICEAICSGSIPLNCV